MGIVNFKPKNNNWGSCSDKESGSDSKKKHVEIRRRSKKISKELIKRAIKNKRR